MRNFVKLTMIAAIMALSFVFTGCDTTQQRSSAPKVEIVERSDLLNRIDMNYILPADKVRQLSDQGLDVTFSHFMLTSDTQATFDLLLTNKDGAKLTLPVHALLDYDHTVVDGKDVFTDIQLYWGDVDLYGDSIIVTNMSQPIRFSLADMDMKWEKYDTSFADGGYIIDSVQTGENMAFLYYTENDEGIAVFDADSQLVSRTSFVKTKGSSNLADVSSGFVPAVLQNTAHIHETGGALYTEGTSHSYIFDYSRNALYTSGRSPWKTYTRDDRLWTVLRFENSTGGSIPFIYMAVEERNGQTTERQTFTSPVSLANADITMAANGNGQPVLNCAQTGMTITVDFTNDTAYTQFSITEDMLAEKLYTSKDKAYELYSYALSEKSAVPAYHIALKETATGAIRYIGEIGMINGYYEGETGFMNDNTIYLLTGEDYREFTTDMTAGSHTFALADYFPLGVITDSYDTRHLVSATATGGDSLAVVYYEDNLMAADEDRFADLQSKTTLKSVYKVALFDTEGNMTATYDTGINVICGWCPVHSYIKGDDISITVTYKNTDHIFTKGTLNLTDGAFTLVKDYTAPDKW